MCVICVKKKGLAFPEKKWLKNCFDNNDDGAGFMYAANGRVNIIKGFDTFEKFWSALGRARRKVGDDKAFVMHFRIATQGFEMTMTHPFPLSEKMSDLKMLRCKCNIGVAHNGIISLTSDGSKHYSDTMKFITDYMSLLVRGFGWRKNQRVRNAIEGLIHGSRLSVMDKYGNTDELGDGWVDEEGILYSNTSYKYPGVRRLASLWNPTGYYGGLTTSAPKEKECRDVPWELYRNSRGEYEFTEEHCPFSEDEDDTMCGMCANRKECVFWQGVDMY